jgi:signal transduction histidine kinase
VHSTTQPDPQRVTPPAAGDSNDEVAGQTSGGVRAPLFRKYLVAFAMLTTSVLVVSGVTQSYFSYRESTSVLGELQQEKGLSAASTIARFVSDIQEQIQASSPTTTGPGPVSRPDREDEFRRLLRRAPAISDVSYVDADGREQVRVSRLALNALGSETDRSHQASFAVAKAAGVYFSPTFFREQSEPYMTVAVAETGATGGVTVADVNLKLIWDVISRIKVGSHGYAYIVDASGSLIAHPDISLVLQRTDMSALGQVQDAIRTEARARDPSLAHDLNGREVLTASTFVDPPGWWVFVEQPSDDAFAPAYSALQRTATLVVGALVLSLLASLLLARRMVKPIQALQAGAERIGAGGLGQRIDVTSGDELEALAQEFNRMAGRLRESYANLEQKVDVRTRALAEAMGALEAKSQQLEVASAHKSEFLAHMSHELRTPLNAIIGFSEVLIEQTVGELNAKQGQYLEDILDSGRHLLSVINDILDLSKIEAGRMDLDVARFWLPETLEESLTMVREEAHRRGIELALRVSPEVGFLDADERKVKQVLFNLLSNAVKFTQRGKVELSAAVADDEVRVAVRDTGVGIAAVDQQAVFEEFYQARARSTEAAPGTGLGLPLSKRFVALHGGRMWLDSAPGRGSTFTFTLPLVSPAAVVADEDLLAAAQKPPSS